MTIGAAETKKVLISIFVMIDFLFNGLTLRSFGIFTRKAFAKNIHC